MSFPLSRRPAAGRRSSDGTALATPMQEGVWLVALGGEHDITTHPTVEGVFAPLRPPCVIVLDLSEVIFFDTSTLALILRTSQRISEAGGLVLVVAAPGTFPQRLFEIAGVGLILSVHESRESARNAIPERLL